MPDAHREPVFAFVRGNVCSKTEIGLKATGNGMIAITNWHLLNDSDTAEDVEEIEALGAPPNPQQVISAALPLKLKAERDESGNPALSEGQRADAARRVEEAAQTGSRLCPDRHGAPP